MAREIGRLTALQVQRAAAGMHPDGGGLYLRVTGSGSRSWILRYMIEGRAREMGLGPVHTVGLAEARRRAQQARLDKLDGIDPIAARQSSRHQARLDAAKAITFKDAARHYIAAHQATWRNAKHAAQWGATLEAYAYPVFGGLAVAAVDTGLVLAAIEPIWSTKPETANRVRGRIELVLDWAAARDYRAKGDNPARWRGHLDKILPSAAKAKQAARRAGGRGAHHAALPYGEIAGFVAELRRQPGTAARALEFAILTAARTGEVLGASWGEIDFANRVWTVPADRIKGGREHRVPLCDRAIELLGEPPGAKHKPSVCGIAQIRNSAWLFPGQTAGKALSNMALLMLLRRIGRGDLTAHGFRSTFRDWAAERTNFPREVAEMALAHVVADKVEAAYRRGDLFDKRRQLMTAWGRFCDTPVAAAGAVVALRRA